MNKFLFSFKYVKKTNLVLISRESNTKSRKSYSGISSQSITIKALKLYGKLVMLKFSSMVKIYSKTLSFVHINLDYNSIK